MSRNKDADKSKILKTLYDTPIVTAACQKIGLPRATYYRWRQEDIEFAVAADKTIEIGTYRVNDLAESKMITLIQEGDFRAIAFWLNNKHPDYDHPKLASKGRRIPLKPVYVMDIRGRQPENRNRHNASGGSSHK